MGVKDFLTRVEYFVSIEVGFMPIESDRKIDVISQFTLDITFD
jgi:hypothetical protein